MVNHASKPAVPREFGEAVERARAARIPGDLRLLALEARDFPWAVEGLREVGRAQFSIEAWRGARETFERLREQRPDDVEANERLATVYDRLARSEPEEHARYAGRSREAIERVLDSPGPGSWDRAEAQALKARNIKTAWRAGFEARTGTEARLAALRSPELAEAFEAYAAAFGHDPRHVYSGVNALGLLRIRLDLARALPDTWAQAFARPEEAGRERGRLEARVAQLATAVSRAIEDSRSALLRRVPPDAERQRWTEVSAADLAFLTVDRPDAVAQQYRRALDGATRFVLGSVRDQLEIFERLALRLDAVRAALAVVDEQLARAPALPPPAGEPIERLLLFTGHMIDTRDRPEPRFPPTPAAEAEARRLIEEAVRAERAVTAGRMAGIAGGACGGDILFHEVCAAMGIETSLLLALPAASFSAASVAHAGPRWVDRFERLCERVPLRVLAEGHELPSWLRHKKDYGLWQRNNLWTLCNALSLDARSLTLLALWDGGPADGPGGTEDIVRQVAARGYKVVRLPAERLKAFAASGGA